MRLRNRIIVTISFAFLIVLISSANAFANNTTYVAVNLSSEITNSGLAGYNFTQNDFSVSSPSQCVRVLISNCDNNNPSQFLCINGAYKSSYEQQHADLSFNESGFCPEYILAGYISCAMQSNYCVVTRNSNFTSPNQNNTQNNLTNSTVISTSATSSATTTVLPSINSTSVNNGLSTISNIINEIIQFFQTLLQKI